MSINLPRAGGRSMAFSDSGMETAAIWAAAGSWVRDLPLSAWPLWAQAALWLWIAALGASVGSFLNVVIYRAPRGMSLLSPASFCPECRHAIRARDNIPLLGWLLLRGRCRDCSAPISPRYPLVEGLVAVLFVGVAAVYLGLDGATLPPPPGELAGVPAWTERRLTALCLFQLLLASYLLAVAAIHWDGQRMPRWIVLLVAAVGLAAPCIWPWLRPLPSGISGFAGAEVAALVDAIAGTTAGLLAGAIRRLAAPNDDASQRKHVRRAGRLRAQRHARPKLVDWINPVYVVLGIFLGWQGVLIVAGAAAAAGALLALVGRSSAVARRLPDEAFALAATILLTAAWHWPAAIAARGRWQGILLAAGLVTATLLLAVLQRRLLARGKA